MNIVSVLKILAALATVATGLLSLVNPAAVYSFTGLVASGARGVSEIRAIFGGLFIALGLAPFLLGASGGATAYRVLGIGYLAIAAARLFSMVFDHSYAQSNIISLAVEIVFGAMLIF